MDLKIYIGKRVKAARQRKGLTQEGLAEAIGKATETISNVERGFALTGLGTLQRIGKTLGVPLGHFFEGFESAPRRVDKVRADAEERLISLVSQSLRTEDISLAISLIETLAKHRK